MPSKETLYPCIENFSDLKQNKTKLEKAPGLWDSIPRPKVPKF